MATAVQTKVIEAMRNAKKQPIDLGANLNQPKPVAATEAELAEPSMAQIVWDLTRNMMPSTRSIIAYVAHISILTVGTIGAWSLVNSMLVGAVALSGGMFLAFVVGLLAMCIAVWAASKLGHVAAGYISSGAIDRHLSNAKESVLGIFRAAPKTA
jgi:hypothetical protein